MIIIYNYYSIRFENVLIEHNDIEVKWTEKYWTIDYF